MRYWILPLFMFGIFSCQDERDPCLQPKQIHLTMHFKKYQDSLSTDTLLPNVNLIAKIGDSLVAFYLGQKKVNNLIIPMNSTLDSMQWFLQTDSNNTSFDTIVLHYQRQLKFISAACGFYYFYNIDSLQSTHHQIDSVNIANPQVTNDVNKTHLLFYF